MTIERTCVMVDLNNTVYNTKSVQVISQYRSGNKDFGGCYEQRIQ